MMMNEMNKNAINGENEMMNRSNDACNMEKYELVNVLPHCPVMMVLDTSHSMWGKGMLDLKHSLDAFFRSIRHAQIPESMIDIAAVSMGDNLGLIEDFVPMEHSVLQNLVLRPKGNTPLGGALKLALMKIREQIRHYSEKGVAYLPAQLIVLSDGISSDEFEFQAEEIRRAVKNSSLVCRAVALGSHPDLSALEQIAGPMVLNPNGDSMCQAFAEVGRMVSVTCEEAISQTLDESELYSVQLEDLDSKMIDVPAVEDTPAHESVPAESSQTSSVPDDKTFFLLDGSNIIHWDHCGKEISLDGVLAITGELEKRNYPYQVYFDATARHLFKYDQEVKNRYEELLKNDPQHFRQVPAGTRADDFLLMIASRDSNAKIITNDRYCEYADLYPQVVNRERLLPGMVFDGLIFFPGISMQIPFSCPENV